MRREQAGAIFDALVVDGYNATLHVWHGTSIEKSTVGTDETKYGPIYNVETGARDCRNFSLDELRQLGDIAENVGATVVVEDGSPLRARFRA